MTYPFPDGDSASLAQCLGKPLVTGQKAPIAPIALRNRCNVTLAVPLDTVEYRPARSSVSGIVRIVIPDAPEGPRVREGV
jgi:hypothetical protein